MNKMYIGIGAIVVAVVLVALVFIPITGGYWADDDYDYRKLISVSPSVVEGSLTNFPLLISLSSDQGLISHAQPDGDDIFFTLVDGTDLNHEIEWYDGGNLVAWVGMPTLSDSGPLDIYMYYGNSVTTGSSNSALWDGDYKAVWHMSEPTGVYHDSTGNNNDVEVMNMNARRTGKIGSAPHFTTGNYLEIPYDPSLDFTNSIITMECWVNLEDPDIENRIICKEPPATPCTGLGWNVETVFPEYDGAGGSQADGGEFNGISLQNGDFSPRVAHTNSSMLPNLWYHIAVAYDDAAMQGWPHFYINGVRQTAWDNYGPDTGMAGWTPGEYYTRIGTWAGSASWHMLGIIDEMRLSHSVRSADWILTSYQTQVSPAISLMIGVEESR